MATRKRPSQQAKITLSIAALMAATLLSAPASAATTAEATTALNIRSGPGPQYDVIGVIKENDQAIIEGCIEGCGARSATSR